MQLPPGKSPSALVSRVAPDAVATAAKLSEAMPVALSEAAPYGTTRVSASVSAEMAGASE
jgi:hypothetical protein